MIAKLLISFLFLIQASSILACDERLKVFERDCSIQDRFKYLQSRIDNLNSISIYKALRFIDRHSYQSAIGKQRPVEEIFEPYSTWLIWSYSESIILNRFSYKTLSLSDLQEIRAISMSQSLNEAKNKAAINAKDPFRKEVPVLFDVSSNQYTFWKDIIETNDLPVSLELVSKEDYYEVHYVDGLDILSDLKDWKEYYDETITKVERGELAPVEASAILQRYFVAIHPFTDGNGRVSGFIQDLLSKGFNLPYFPRGDLQVEFELNSRDYVELTYQKLDQMLDSLESCLKRPLSYPYSCKKIQ